MFKHIFADSEEKFLKANVLYANATDSILYKVYNGETYKDAVSAEDLANLFNKGMLLIDDGTNLVRPTVLTVAEDYATVSYVTVASTTASVVVYGSDGYTAE